MSAQVQEAMADLARHRTPADRVPVVHIAAVLQALTGRGWRLQKPAS